MPANIREIMDIFVRKVRSLYGQSLDSIILYGSYARGDYTELSDVDVMILVTLSEKEIKKTTEQVVDFAFDLFMEYGLDIVPIVKNVEHFTYWADNLPFYRNIREEGVRLSA